LCTVIWYRVLNIKKAIALAKVLYGHYGESDQNFLPRATDFYFTSLVSFQGYLVMCHMNKKKCSMVTAVDVTQIILLLVGAGLHYFLKEPAQNYFANLPHWQSDNLDVFHLGELARYHTVTLSLLFIGIVLNVVLIVTHVTKIVDRASSSKSLKRNKSR